MLRAVIVTANHRELMILISIVLECRLPRYRDGETKSGWRTKPVYGPVAIVYERLVDGVWTLCDHPVDRFPYWPNAPASITLRDEQ